MMTTATKPNSLAEITREEQPAATAAAKAAQAAEQAKARADRARDLADREREVANRSYLDLLAQEHPDARSTALSAAGDAHQNLDLAVRNGGDVFGAYIAWVDASVKVWETDEALARMRRFFGEPTRDVAAPVFNFGSDLGVIIDQVSFERQDEAVQHIDARRANYLAGRKES